MELTLMDEILRTAVESGNIFWAKAAFALLLTHFICAQIDVWIPSVPPTSSWFVLRKAISFAGSNWNHATNDGDFSLLQGLAVKAMTTGVDAHNAAIAAIQLAAQAGNPGVQPPSAPANASPPPGPQLFPR